MAFTKDPCAGARGGTDVTITLTAVYRRVADGNKDPRPKALGVFLDRHLSLTLGDKWKEAWKVDGPFCSRGNRCGKWIPLLLASGEGRGARNRGEGRGAGQKVAGPFRSTSRKSPCLKVRRKFCVAPKVPRTLAIPFRAPIGATGGQATVCACRSSGAGKALCCRVAGSWG